MANPNRPNGFRAIRKLNGGIPQYTPKYAASGLSIAVGDALVITTAGILSLATASSPAIFGVSDSKITGIAGVQQKVNVVEATDDILFVGQTTTWESASKRMIGSSVDIGGGSGAMILTSSTSQGVARIIGLSREMGNADGNYARMEFVFQKSQFTGQA